MSYRFPQDDLTPRSFGSGVLARVFHGNEHGGTAISVMLGELDPGSVVALHKHAYEELFLIQEGEASFTIGDEIVPAVAGDFVLIPAGLPHTFSNVGAGKLRQVAMHAAPAVSIEWLDS